MMQNSWRWHKAVTVIPQKTLINIFGQPCTGKSTLVDRIVTAQDGIYCVDFDVVKRQLSGYYWKRDRDFSRQLTQDFLDVVVRSGKPIIALLPMARNKEQYDDYFRLAKVADYRIINITLTLDRTEHIDRYKLRLESIRKNNPDFKVKTLDEFTAMISEDWYTPKGTVVLDSGKFDPEVLYSQFLKIIDAQ